MKKFLSIVGLAMVLSVANAQNHLSQSFLNVLSLNVSNTLSITNLQTMTAQTNILGVTWTNFSNTKVTVAAAGNTAQLLRDVNLWADRDGMPLTRQIYSAQGSTTNFLEIQPARLFLRLHGGSGANAAVTFTFQPLWDGETPPGSAVTTDNWSVALTATTTTPVTLATNVPFHRWPGAKKLRLLSIVNADTDASSQVTVTKASLNGFVP